MVVSLQRQLSDNKHRFKAVQPGVPKEKMARIPREAFELHAARRTIPLGAIVSACQTTGCHSPAANNNWQNIVGHAMLEGVGRAYGRITNLEKAWQVCSSMASMV